MERSSTPGSYQGNRIFPDEDKGTRWTRQVHRDEEGGDDRSRSKGNKGNTRAKKEQKKRGEDRKGDKDNEILDRMRERCITEAEAKGKEDEKERKSIVQNLKQACVTLWISHQKYHCAIDTPMNERIDPIEMSSGKYKTAGKTPKENRCMKCAKTLAAARAMSSDVITHNSNKGSWRCRQCDDKENKREEKG